MSNKKELEYNIDSNGCHNVTSHKKQKDGRHYIHRDGKSQLTHRYAYEQYHGKIDDNLVVRHKCDNQSCINIEHLELGSHEDNVMDRVERNRSATGTSNGRSKLTEEQARFIKYDEEHSKRGLARMFNVDYNVVDKIKKGINWKHI